MKKNIHPQYNKVLATCSCGTIIDFYSTINKNISLDVCANCHPFYTGKQRTIDTGKRIEKFKKRFFSFS